MHPGVVFELERTRQPIKAIISQAPEVVANQHIMVLVGLIRLKQLRADNFVGAVRIKYVENLTHDEMKYINDMSPLNDSVE